MEPRQIEVWFQNHRRRAKLEGRPIRKRGPTDPPPFQLCLKSMEEKMEPYLIPAGLRQSIDDEELFDGYHKYSSAILRTQQFYFPPRIGHENRCGDGGETPTVTIDECIAEFAKLHVYDRQPSFPCPSALLPPFPSPAPLPALVRGKFTPSPVSPTALNIVPRRAHGSAPSARPARTRSQHAGVGLPEAEEGRWTAAPHTEAYAGLAPWRQPRVVRHLDAALVVRGLDDALILGGANNALPLPALPHALLRVPFPHAVLRLKRLLLEPLVLGLQRAHHTHGLPLRAPTRNRRFVPRYFRPRPTALARRGPQHPRGKQQPYQFAFAGYARR
ncbi:hypothetical protein DFH09DRAFT_1440236 [Mycena vulgaris]|nr:hypothetical protein DFH09DRAFT_1440236 [Mycena vulgaris]